MTWLTWRLQRIELLLLALLTALFAGLLISTRSDVIETSSPRPASECPRPLIGTEGVCPIETGALFNFTQGSTEWFNFLPLLAAMLIALPLISELESGVYRFTWTQGVTRLSWARFRLAVIAALTLAFSTIFGAGFQWWASPTQGFSGRILHIDVDLRGVVPIGHLFFAVGLMLAGGVMLRRPVLTIVIGSTVYLGVRLPFIIWIREHLMLARTHVGQPFDVAYEPGDWELSSSWIDANGNRLSYDQFDAFCNSAAIFNADGMQACAERNGLSYLRTYHPASHFWPMQLIETAIFLGAGLALIGFAAWWMLRRVE